MQPDHGSMRSYPFVRRLLQSTIYERSNFGKAILRHRSPLYMGSEYYSNENTP